MFLQLVGFGFASCADSKWGLYVVAWKIWGNLALGSQGRRLIAMATSCTVKNVSSDGRQYRTTFILAALKSAPT
ncbi:MAG: hypothetical protein ACLUKN_17205 [Bacilli bacterium]